MRDNADDVDEAVRALFCDVPPMDEEIVQSGRGQIQAMVETDPLAKVTVLDRITSPSIRPRRTRAAPMLTAAAAAAVLAAGAGVLLSGGTVQTDPTIATQSTPPDTGRATPTVVPVLPRPDDSLPRLAPLPASPLNPAGELAAKVTDPQLKPTEFWFRQVTHTPPAVGGAPAVKNVMDTWTSPHGLDGLTQITSGVVEHIPTGAFEVDLGRCAHEADGMVVCPHPGPWAPTMDNIAAMPRDPAALYEKLRAYVNAGSPPGTKFPVAPPQDAADKLLTLINNGLIVRADLRAALLTTLGYLPGITIANDVRATDGRQAVAVSFELDNGNYRNELLIDPTTGRAIERRNVAIKTFNGHQPGEVFDPVTIKEAIVPAAREYPR